MTGIILNTIYQVLLCYLSQLVDELIKIATVGVVTFGASANFMPGKAAISNP